MSNGNQTIHAPGCTPPGRVSIGNTRREITWINPGGTVTDVQITGGPTPNVFFVNGQRLGPNYQLTFLGSAPEDSVWTYAITCGNGAEQRVAQGGTQPELTNGPG